MFTVIRRVPHPGLRVSHSPKWHKEGKRGRGSIYDAHYNRFAGDRRIRLLYTTPAHERANRAISREKLVPSRDDEDGTEELSSRSRFRAFFVIGSLLCRAMRAEWKKNIYIHLYVYVYMYIVFTGRRVHKHVADYRMRDDRERECAITSRRVKPPRKPTLDSSKGQFFFRRCMTRVNK